MRSRSKGPDTVTARRLGAARPSRHAEVPSGFLTGERNEAFGLPREPWLPPASDDADRAAFRALHQGNAAPHQQMRALRWLMYATGVDGPSYVPGDPHDTAYAEGKRRIGIEIRKLILFRSASSEGSEHG